MAQLPLSHHHAVLCETDKHGAMDVSTVTFLSWLSVRAGGRLLLAWTLVCKACMQYIVGCHVQICSQERHILLQDINAQP